MIHHRTHRDPVSPAQGAGLDPGLCQVFQLRSSSGSSMGAGLPQNSSSSSSWSPSSSSSSLSPPPVLTSPRSVLRRPVSVEELGAPGAPFIKKMFRVFGDEVGWGFVVRGARPCHIQAVEPHGPAAVAGMKICQLVVSVNGTNVLHLDFRTISRLILTGPRILVMEVMEEAPPPEDRRDPPPKDRKTTPPEDRRTPPPKDRKTLPTKDRRTPPFKDRRTLTPKDRRTPPPKDRRTPPPKDRRTPPPKDRKTLPSTVRETLPPTIRETPPSTNTGYWRPKPSAAIACPPRRPVLTRVWNPVAAI